MGRHISDKIKGSMKTWKIHMTNVGIKHRKLIMDENLSLVEDKHGSIFLVRRHKIITI
jgi:hypothetical protein